MRPCDHLGSVGIPPRQSIENFTLPLHPGMIGVLPCVQDQAGRRDARVRGDRSLRYQDCMHQPAS